MTQPHVANTTSSIADWLRSRYQELPKQQSGLLIRLTVQYQAINESKDDLNDLYRLLPIAKEKSTAIAIDVENQILELEAKIDAATRHLSNLMLKAAEFQINQLVMKQWRDLVEKAYPI